MLGSLVVAGIVHLAAILAFPDHAPGDAYGRVAALPGASPLKTVPGPPTSRGVFPFQDPAIATAFCLYDLGSGPVRVTLDVGGADFLAVTLHDRHGRAFYGLTDRSASRDKVALTLVTEAQDAEARTQQEDDETLDDLRVVAPEPAGFVEVLALAATPSLRAAAEAAAGRLRCETGPSR